MNGLPRNTALRDLLQGVLVPVVVPIWAVILGGLTLGLSSWVVYVLGAWLMLIFAFRRRWIPSVVRLLTAASFGRTPAPGTTRLLSSVVEIVSAIWAGVAMLWLFFALLQALTGP